MYQTIHKQESFTGTKKFQKKNRPPDFSDSLKETNKYLYSIPMNDAKTCYNSAYPVQLYALAFTRNANVPVASDQKRHETVTQQNLQSTKNLSVQRSPVIQRKYYDPLNNKITIKKHLPITDEIKDAKSNIPNITLTAHHIIPWAKLKEYIETAFELNPNGVSNTFLTLEAFANKRFPIDKQKFIQNRVKRIANYIQYGAKIDQWIQYVCWSPKNIFIGPLANNRVDDPGNRTGDQTTSMDAHFAGPNVKSSRSEILTSLPDFNLNAEVRETIEDMEQDITSYNPSEWNSYKLNQRTYYYQKNDPYFENHAPARYLYDASITRTTVTPGNTGYEILFYTLYNFSIRDLTFQLSANNQSIVNYLYQNSVVNNNLFHVQSYIIADPILDNCRKYLISFEVPGINATVYNLKAIIMSESGRTVECPIR